MSSDWDKVVLSNAIEIIGGGTPKTSIDEYWNGDIPWLSVVDFNGSGRFVFETEKTITEEGLINSSTKILDEGDIIISARGTVGALAQLGKPMAFNQSCYGVRGKNGQTFNDFLYYLLVNTVNYLKRIAHGGVFDTITRSTFDNITVRIPSIAKQKEIAIILGSLDQKIHLNQQTNETLEAMAQAIFKSWFLDFDPVLAKLKANEDGRDPNRAAMAVITGVASFAEASEDRQNWDEIEAALEQKLRRMTEEQCQQLSRTAELFPDELVDSEIGEVPKGWWIKPFKEVCEDIQSGGTPKRSEPEYWGKGLSWLSSGEIRNKYLLNSEEQITEKGLAESNAKLWPSGSTIIAMYGATAGVTAYLAKEMCANQACCCLMPNKNSAFVFISALRASRELSGKSTGSAQQNLNKGIIERHKILVPQDEIIDVFEKFSSQLIDRIISNEEENESLSDLRDMLLPKLISGEVGV
jgi:type I restriction enzyme S subunit